ncbi:MAG: hypothetical protein K2K15_03865 [Anaeroplasmataceae bacterium]|nr:hypothetical protein [Anaeroplasmataceae bacterium]
MQKTLANVQFKTIQERLLELSKSSSLIHVTISNRRNKIVEAPSKIIGIYQRFLCVESQVQSYLEKFTINYTDLMTGNIIIKEF